MAQANLNVGSNAFAYSDTQKSSNPIRQNFNWQRSWTSLPVTNPQSQDFTIAPGATQVLFNGIDSITSDGTTAWTVTLNPLSNTVQSIYRFTWSGGTNPTLRTNRNLTLTGQAITIAKNLDSSVNLSTGGGTFGSVVAGDTVFLPGPTTGDSSTVFNALNQGYWTVIAVLSSTSLQLVRPAGTTFQYQNETQTLGSNGQLIAYSAAGVQVNDSVAIKSGFSAQTQGTYGLTAVTPGFFEVVSPTPLALESAITPGSTGLVFYNNAKRFIRLEADQNVAIQLNASTDASTIISPIIAGDDENKGWFELWGSVYQITAINKSNSILNLQLFSVQ